MVRRGSLAVVTDFLIAFLPISTYLADSDCRHEILGLSSHSCGFPVAETAIISNLCMQFM